MSNFGEMSLDDQAELVKKVGGVLKETELGDVKVKIYREEVCQLTGADVMGRTMMMVEKSLPASDKEKAEKFNEQIKEVTNGVEGLKIAVNSALGQGDMYQTIKNVTTLEDDSKPVDIEHEKDTVMMIDFWATWCPPCQRPMQHNQDMLTEHAAKWGGKVKIIGLSIDGAAETVKNHINNKGWTAPIHYWRSKSDCSDVYQVKGVPHVLIVDKTGKIVFKGHPANRKDLVKDFDDLLAGKTLEGLDDSQPAAAEGDDEAGNTVNLDKIKEQMTEMTNFKATGKELQEECKEKAAGMMRNFCVLTLEAEYHPNKESWTSTYTNHRVLVGPQEKIDHCKGKIEEKLGTEQEKKDNWTFKLNEQIQAM